MISKKAIALCATVGVALSGVALASPASADPVSNSYAVVGSDTLEDVVGALANGTSITGSFVRTTTGGFTIGSFDATGSSYITTKPGSVRFGRPNGSSDGVKALSRSIDGGPFTSATAGGPASVVVTGAIDIARSSSGGTVNANGELQYIPFGRDALAYVYKGDPSLANLSGAVLKDLYECTITTVGGIAVKAIVAQSGSGTRKDWLAKIGTTEAGLKTVSEGGCVIEAQEHDGTALNAFPDAVAGMAVSRWIAMNTGASFDRRGTGVSIASAISGVSPVNGSGASMVPNPTYYADGTWGRDTYLVVEFARLATDPGLAALVNPSIATSLTNSSTLTPGRSGSVKLKFGFLAPTAGLTPFRVAKTP